MERRPDWKALVRQHARASGAADLPGAHRRGARGPPRGFVRREAAGRCHQRRGVSRRGGSACRVAARCRAPAAATPAGITSRQRGVGRARAPRPGRRLPVRVASVAALPVLRGDGRPDDWPRRRRRNRHLQHRRHRASAPAPLPATAAARGPLGEQFGEGPPPRKAVACQLRGLPRDEGRVRGRRCVVASGDQPGRARPRTRTRERDRDERQPVRAARRLPSTRPGVSARRSAQLRRADCRDQRSRVAPALQLGPRGRRPTAARECGTLRDPRRHATRLPFS